MEKRDKYGKYNYKAVSRISSLDLENSMMKPPMALFKIIPERLKKLTNNAISTGTPNKPYRRM